MAYVQKKVVNSTSLGTSHTATFDSNTTAGNACELAILVGADNSTLDPVVAVSGLGATWTVRQEKQIPTSPGARVEVWRGTGLSGANHTVTVTSTNVMIVLIAAFEVSGTDPASDLSNSTNGTGGGTASTGTIAIPGAGEAIAAMLDIQWETITPGGSGWTQEYENENPASGIAGNILSKTFSSSATEGATWSITTALGWAAAVLYFPTAGAPPDTDPPTLSSAATNSAGTSVTATISESGCVADGGGTSGSGGFTLIGTSATVSAWAISGTTLTFTVSGTIYQGQTVTHSYARSGTTDDIKDAAGNYLADFSGASVTNNSTVGYIFIPAGTTHTLGADITGAGPLTIEGEGPTSILAGGASNYRINKASVTGPVVITNCKVAASVGTAGVTNAEAAVVVSLASGGSFQISSVTWDGAHVDVTRGVTTADITITGNNVLATATFPETSNPATSSSWVTIHGAGSSGHAAQYTGNTGRATLALDNATYGVFSNNRTKARRSGYGSNPNSFNWTGDRNLLWALPQPGDSQCEAFYESGGGVFTRTMVVGPHWCMTNAAGSYTQTALIGCKGHQYIRNPGIGATFSRLICAMGDTSGSADGGIDIYTDGNTGVTLSRLTYCGSPLSGAAMTVRSALAKPSVIDSLFIDSNVSMSDGGQFLIRPGSTETANIGDARLTDAHHNGTTFPNHTPTGYDGLYGLSATGTTGNDQVNKSAGITGLYDTYDPADLSNLPFDLAALSTDTSTGAWDAAWNGIAAAVQPAGASAFDGTASDAGTIGAVAAAATLTPITVSLATILSDGNGVSVSFNTHSGGNLTPSTPTGFTLKRNGVAEACTASKTAGVEITLIGANGPFFSIDTVTFSITSSDLSDGNGDATSDVSNHAVTNNSTLTAPSGTHALRIGRRGVAIGADPLLYVGGE